MNGFSRFGDGEMITVQFESVSGTLTGDPLYISTNAVVMALKQMLSAINEKPETDPCSFYVNGQELNLCIKEALTESDRFAEKTVKIVYQYKDLFIVRPVTRCTSSIPGHAEAIVSVAFSPDGKRLASGSGDTTVRFWDLDTQTPHFASRGHKNWVMVVSWDPTATKLASGCKRGEIIIWDAVRGVKIGKSLLGHKNTINAIVWKPAHLDGKCREIASCSKDMSIRLWDVAMGNCLKILSGHTASITCLKWGGSNILYSGSQDRTIKAWTPVDGRLITTFTGHSHWVNSIALSTDYASQCGPFGPKNKWSISEASTSNDIWEASKTRYEELVDPDAEERLVSASDDHTLFLWAPSSRKPITRMHGHYLEVTEVKYSPDGSYIVSASFDKAVRIWNAANGNSIATLRGHVQRVYQISFSPDSKMLISGSSDSTLKLWNMSNFNLESDLPGHDDEVYAVDWSPDGQVVASGGKDKVLKLWKY